MNWKKADTDCEWIFFPLPSDEAHYIAFWIKGMRHLEWKDEPVETLANTVIKRELKKYNLRYNEDKFGKPVLGSIRLYSGSDGFCIPETCFVELPEGLSRINNPLKSTA
ncbi:MAG: hypothetical protein ACI8WB_004733 [Phenylobacterium sp.]|jgi:hypothetical protein